MNKVPVVQGLQAEIGEQVIVLGQQCGAQSIQIEVGQLWPQQFKLNTLLNKALQRQWVAFCHLALGGGMNLTGAVNVEEGQSLGTKLIQK